MTSIGSSTISTPVGRQTRPTFTTGLKIDVDSDNQTNDNNLISKTSSFQPTLSFEITKNNSSHKSPIHLQQYLTQLPNTINMITLREMLLSDAPFVNNMNRNYWKKWIDSKPFGQLLATIYHLVTSCFTENGTIYIDILYNNLYKTDIYSKSIANNFIQMFLLTNLSKSNDRDRFFIKFPEILFYMVINGLLAAIPKHHRIYNSVKFREILLDFMLELISKF